MNIVKNNIGLTISTIIGIALLICSFYIYYSQGSERALVILIFAIVFDIALVSSWKDKIKNG